MDMLHKLQAIELSNDNQAFIRTRMAKYSQYSSKHLDRKILNSYCDLLALLKIKSSQ